MRGCWNSSIREGGEIGFNLGLCCLDAALGQGSPASAPAGAKISDSRAAVQALIRATPEAAAYLPFTATLNGSHWQLDGSRLDNTAPLNDTRHYQVETATGKVSELK